MQTRLVSPTGGGLYAKLVLVRVDRERWSAVGSLNGGGISQKISRSVMLLVDAPAIYDRLAKVVVLDCTLLTH